MVKREKTVMRTPQHGRWIFHIPCPKLGCKPFSKEIHRPSRCEGGWSERSYSHRGVAVVTTITAKRSIGHLFGPGDRHAANCCRQGEISHRRCTINLTSVHFRIQLPTLRHERWSLRIHTVRICMHTYPPPCKVSSGACRRIGIEAKACPSLEFTASDFFRCFEELVTDATLIHDRWAVRISSASRVGHL